VGGKISCTPNSEIASNALLTITHPQRILLAKGKVTYEGSQLDGFGLRNLLPSSHVIKIVK
jgi:hypothetical protein